MAQRKAKPPIFYRMREKVIEAIAINMITQSITEDGCDGQPLPISWVHEAENIKNEMASWIVEQAAEEDNNQQRRDLGRAAKVNND